MQRPFALQLDLTALVTSWGGIVSVHFAKTTLSIWVGVFFAVPQQNELNELEMVRAAPILEAAQKGYQNEH